MIIGTYNISKRMLHKLITNFKNTDIRIYEPKEVITFGDADLIFLPDVLLVSFDEKNIHLLDYLTDIYHRRCMVMATIAGEGIDNCLPYKFAYETESEMNLSTTAIYNMAQSMRKEKSMNIDALSRGKYYDHNEYINIDMQRYISFIETKDHYTKGHCERTAMYASYIADRLNFSLIQKKLVRDACIIHDVGKIALPIELITKEGRLTIEEYNLVKEHTSFVNQLLPENEFKSIKEVISAHHERYDGMGYPHGLHGDQIKIEARVLGTVDSFDAMTTNRGYNAVKSLNSARDELMKYSGTQFDPYIVKAFIDLLDHNYNLRSYFFNSQSELSRVKSR